LNNGRCYAVIVTHANIGAENLVFGAQLPNDFESIRFGQGLGEIKRIRASDRVRNYMIYELFQGSEAEYFKHLHDVRISRPNMTILKGIWGV
jgi:hypothetical protein